MAFNEKIKTIDEKREQNNSQHDIDGKTAKSSTLSSENVGKLFYQINDLEKVATIKII